MMATVDIIVLSKMTLHFIVKHVVLSGLGTSLGLV
jgi:hypothetical protein